MAINLHVKIQKKDLWLLTAIFVFLVGVAYVIAWGSGQPTIHGHDAGEIEGGIIQPAQAVGTTNINAPAAWVDMSDMIINMNTNGGDVLLIFSGNIYASGNDNAAAELRFDVDGNPRHVMKTEAGDGAWQNDFSMQWLETSLPAGSHTFKVQWIGSQNPGAVHQDGATYPRIFTAIEL